MPSHYGPPIVNKNLVVWHDPIDKNCYGGSGTTVNNLAGIPTMTCNGDSPSHSYSNPGFFTYNGSNQQITLPASDFSGHELNSKSTISAWINFSGSGQCSFTGTMSSWDNGFKYWGALNNFFYRTGDGTNRSNILNGYNTGLSNNVWNNIVMVRNGQDWLFYTNGTLKTTVSVASIGNTNASHIFRIGSINDWFFNGKIGQVLCYQDALTSNQVMHNYEILRHRYGV